MLEDYGLANGIRLHYYRTGGDKPPLVLCHGWTNNALCWAETMRALDADFDVIAYDARGHGRSERLGERFGEAERTGDLIGVVETLGLRQPVLMGHSMGAATVAAVAAQRPDLLAAVVLEDPPWYAAEPDRAARTASWADWFEWVQTVPSKPRSVALAEYRTQSPQWSDETLNLRLDAYQQMDMRLLTDVTWDFAPWRERASAFRCPWLLIIGEQGGGRDGIVSRAQAEEAVRLSAHGQWAQIADAGHNVRYDQFGKYVEVVGGFLENVKRDKRIDSPFRPSQHP